MLITEGARDAAFATAWLDQLGALADLRWSSRSAPDGWEVLGAGGVHVALDLLGSIDVDAERARIIRSKETAAKEIKQTEAKLGNAGFLAKAPENVVADIRARHAAALEEQERLDARLARLG